MKTVLKTMPLRKASRRRWSPSMPTMPPESRAWPKKAARSCFTRAFVLLVTTLVVISSLSSLDGFCLLPCDPGCSRQRGNVHPSCDIRSNYPTGERRWQSKPEHPIPIQPRTLVLMRPLPSTTVPAIRLNTQAAKLLDSATEDNGEPADASDEDDDISDETATV
jgi:hypothetical protein